MDVRSTKVQVLRSGVGRLNTWPPFKHIDGFFSLCFRLEKRGVFHGIENSTIQFYTSNCDHFFDCFRFFIEILDLNSKYYTSVKAMNQ